MPPATPLPIAVLISGGGTTLRNLFEQIEAGRLPVEVRRVISSRAGVGGIVYAEQAGVPWHVVSRSSFGSDDEFSEDIFRSCREEQVELVVMGGFLKFVPIPDDFMGRVMNIHPSLIPAFCGAGLYGPRVHQAVLDYGTKLTGCTVHFVDNQYDHGPIILQRAVPVLDDDTPESLAARVFQQERQAYPEAIRLFAERRLRIEGRKVRIE